MDSYFEDDLDPSNNTTTQNDYTFSDNPNINTLEYPNITNNINIFNSNLHIYNSPTVNNEYQLLDTHLDTNIELIIDNNNYPDVNLEHQLSNTHLDTNIELITDNNNYPELIDDLTLNNYTYTNTNDTLESNTPSYLFDKYIIVTSQYDNIITDPESPSSETSLENLIPDTLTIGHDPDFDDLRSEIQESPTSKYEIPEPEHLAKREETYDKTNPSNSFTILTDLTISDLNWKWTNIHQFR